MWLFNEVTALYPPIYFFEKPKNLKHINAELNYVYAKITETQRILSILNKYVPVYLFTKNGYNDYLENPKYYTQVFAF